MCGIAGIIDPRGFRADLLSQMNQAIRHRGPDDEGYVLGLANEIQSYRGNDTVGALNDLPHIDSTENTALWGFAHRRLSILDLSATGHQPLGTSDQRHFLTFNGEIYNYQELAQQLIAEGHASASLLDAKSDTHVLLHYLAAYGVNGLSSIRGMFAFAWLDTATNVLRLVRDRFGIKPLYVATKDGRLSFASELKSFFAAGLAEPEVSAKDLTFYLAYGVGHQPAQNLFSTVRDVAPGHYVEYSLKSGQEKSHQWYRLPDKSRKPDWSQEKFEETLQAALEEHLVSDVPVGSCLSGGLDSGAIVSMISERNPARTIQTFTAAYNDASIDESGAVKELASRYTNLESHFTYPSASGFLEDVDRLIHFQEQPIGSTSIFAQWEVMKLAASKGAKVLLDGQGADEILGGYYNFAGIYLLTLLRKGKILKYRRELAALKANFTPNMRSALARAAFYFLPDGMQRRVRKRERIGMKMVAPRYQSILESHSVPRRGGRTFREHSELAIKWSLYELLRYEDRNSMAFSIESRVPFLDHRLVELILDLPDEAKISGGWTKHILRQTVAQRLPETITWRKDKLGFVTPQQAWKAEVLPVLRDYIREANLPAAIDQQYILDLCDRNLSENHDLSEFWRMFSVLKWMEIYNVKMAE